MVFDVDPRQWLWFPGRGRYRLRRLRHHTRVWWAAAVMLGLATFVLTDDLLSDAERARADWTERRSVVVATADILPGDRLGPSNTTQQQLPGVAIPPSALASAADGTTAASPIFRGEVVVGGRVRSSGDAVTGSLPDDTAALAVSMGSASALVEVGDVVDIWIAFDPFVVADRAPTELVATGALVLEADEGVALLAIDTDALAATTAGLSQGTPSLVVKARAG